MGDIVKIERVIFKMGIMNSFKDTNIGSVEDVPIGNKAAVAVLFPEGEGDTFLNSMQLGEDHPASPDSYTTFVMTEEWANSFAKAVNSTPKPLYIGGHAEYGVSVKERPIPDGYLVGAKVINGTLYLRNALPTEGTEAKKELIKQTKREIKAGMLSTSIADIMKYKIVRSDDDYESTYYATESMKGQSNAIVEEDMTGSEADIILTSFKGEPSNSGSKLDDKRGESHMGDEKVITLKEMCTSLRNQLDSGKVPLAEIAKDLGIEVLTLEMKSSLKRLEDAEGVVGPITEYVTARVAEKEASFTALKESKLKEAFKTDELVEIATPLFGLKEGSVEDIDKEVERLTGLQLFKSIQGSNLASMNYTPGNNDGINSNVNDSTVMEG